MFCDREVSSMDKKYAFERTEKEMQKFWEESGIYHFDAGSAKEIYSIDTPPPTVAAATI